MSNMPVEVDDLAAACASFERASAEEAVDVHPGRVE
jgi:hypothetical protein